MSKSQFPNKSQASSPNVKRLGFGIWDLIGHWSLVIGASFVTIQPALAQSPLAVLGDGPDIVTIAARVINIFLSILGVLAVGLILYGGYLWMTSGGETEKIDKAKKLLSGAVIGLVIIFSAFAIVRFIFRQFQVSGLIPGGSEQNCPDCGRIIGSALGQVLEGHWPARDATDVPRNTFIAVMFKMPMDPATLIRDGKVNTASVKIRRSNDSATTGPFLATWEATASEDRKIFLFRSTNVQDYLGSPTENTPYTVVLTDSIRAATGGSPFGSARFYEWSFTVGIRLDLEPPRVTLVLPGGSITSNNHDDIVARNYLVQVNFSEAINPMTVNGRRAMIRIARGVVGQADEVIAGKFMVNPTFMATEFVPDLACGQNACGETIYCLPPNATINVRALAATLIRAGEPTAASPFDGITDMAANSLDGDADTRAEGPPTDDYPWHFGTSDRIDLSSPAISATIPTAGQRDVRRQGDVVQADFTKPLRVIIPPGTLELQAENDGRMTPFAGHQQPRAENHAERGSLFLRVWTPLDGDTSYTPKIASTVHDLYQNCYVPCAGPGCLAREVSPGRYVKSDPWVGPYPSCKLP